MTDEKRELFYTDIQSIVELYKPTYLELMEVFFSFILAQEIYLEDADGEPE